MRAEELFEELSKVVVRWRSLWLLIAALWASVPALATVARAAEDLPQSSAGDVAAGILAGLILAGLIVYALCLAVAPVVRAQRRDFGGALLFLTGLLILKIFALRVSHGFTVDVGTYEAWGLQLAAGGPASMYQSGFFLDYPPGYLYALWAAGTVAKAIGASGDLLRMVIGSPPLLADFALAILIFALVRRFATRSSAWLALLLVALNPALLFDSIVWIQSDSALALVMFLSVVMLLDEEMEVAWALAALSVLMKPQALALIPVLAVWSAIRGNLEQWLRAGLAIIAVVIIGVAPFQVGHPWNWLPQLYLSTAAYYHETSVNAFNFMALLGGIRASDADTIFGLSYFSIGLGLLVPLYGFVAWLLWRYPTRRNLLFAAFIAVFGFFMFAPRMHERYLYPAIVLVVPLAVTESGALALFALLTLTGFINLADVLHTLQTSVFLNPREPLAMAISIANLLIFALAAFYFYTYSNAPEAASDGEGKVQNWTPEALLPYRLWVTSALKPQSLEDFVPFAWLTADTIAVLALVGIAGALRFWNLGHPNEIVFDEVHFVGQARHYIHGEPFLDPHPPLAKLLIAGGILLFGDHSRSWRLANASLGTIMVMVTYLLGRRMFRSRLAAALGAGLIACDGLFIVDSRIGCIDIVYLTFAAIAYWLLFCFIQTRGLARRRWLTLTIGVVLGLCLGSKLYVPAVTFLLVSGFLLFTLWREQPPPEADRRQKRAVKGNEQLKLRRVSGAALMLGSLSAIFYLGCFLPHYALGWWGGVADLIHYYKEVMWYENSVASATHPYASPWWSWPLMLRPVAYWQDFPPRGDVSTIWGAGNPLTWWAIVPAMTITAVRAMERPNLTRLFLVLGYLGYYVIWIPISRILFLYHYMPSAYLGYLALAGILADLWNDGAEWWEGFALLLAVLPVFIVGVGHIATVYQFASERLRPFAGLPFVIALAGAYVSLANRVRYANRLVFSAFIFVAVILFLYYLPVWLGTPITREGYYARMWLQGPGLRNWI